MITDLDIYRTANLMIKQYGENALNESLKRSEEFKAANPEGSKTWEKIACAVKWFLEDNQENTAH